MSRLFLGCFSTLLLLAAALVLLPVADQAAAQTPPLSCLNGLDDDGDTNVNDGCPKKATDDDTGDAAETTAGRRVNDGCPAVGASEKDTAGWCANDLDDDGDTTVNDGCDKVGDVAESGAQCIDPESPACVNAIDDDPTDDGATPTVNDGCPAKGAAETACNNDIDDDADTRVNDGCPKVGSSPENPACANDIDDDGDTLRNDGCPIKPPVDESTVNILPVGGLAELPQVGGSSGANYALLAGGLAAAALVVTGGGWYARRRFSRG